MTAVATDTGAAATGTTAAAASGAAAASQTGAAAGSTGTTTTQGATTTVAAAPVIPESYTLALPEKSLLEPKVTERLTPLLRELKVADNAVGQKVLDAIHGEASEVIKVYEAARAPGGELHKAMVAGFTADARADAFLGNGSDDALNQLSQKVGELLAHYGPEYAARLKETGEAVHPAFLRMMKRIASDVGERPAAQPSGTPIVTNVPLEKRMFPNLNQVLTAPAGTSTT